MTEVENLTEVRDAQPVEEPLKTGKSGASSRKKKTKRLSKKELARRRRERLEQEKQEELRRQKELEDQRLHELELEMEKREKERLNEEESSFRGLQAQRKNQIAKFLHAKEESDEWKRYLECLKTTNPYDQVDVNAFISMWRDATDNEMQPLFDQIQVASELMSALKELKHNAELHGNSREYNRCSEHITELQRLIQDKIEFLSIQHLTFSDHYTGAKNEVLLSRTSAEYSYGMWVNLAKNPRVKEIDFGAMGITIAKNIAMTSLAIRMTISPFATDYAGYLILSDAVACEFLQLPPPPKKIGGIVLRQKLAQGNLQPIAYPLRNVNTVQPPLGFSMKLDCTNLPEDAEELTVIKLDDIEKSKSMISEVTVDRENNMVKFICRTTGVFALAIPKYNQFPLVFWEINTIAMDTIELYLRTGSCDYVLTVSPDGLCSMNTPVTFNGLSAPAAIEFLQRNGINFVSPDAAVSPKITRKQKELESVLAEGIAESVSGFRVRSSKWNAQLNEDRAMFLVREIVEFGDPITEDEDDAEDDETASVSTSATNVSGSTLPGSVAGGSVAATSMASPAAASPEKRETRWHCVVAKSKHIHEAPYSEQLDEPTLKMKDGTNFHQYIHPMFMDFASDSVRQRSQESSGFVVESLRYILGKLKLFSVTL